jgi:hypothetical protein
LTQVFRLASFVKGGGHGLTIEETNIPPTASATEELPDLPQTLQEETTKSESVVEIPAEAKPEIAPQEEKGAEPEPVASESPVVSESPAVSESPVVGEAPAVNESGDDESRRGDRPRDDRRYDGRHGGGRRDRDRPLTNEDKLRIYKKQSEERLLDIKRSKEAKVGKKRK